jgi:hypothetical protein
LYREIGISAVVAALEVSEDAFKDHRTPEPTPDGVKPKAA